LESDGLKRFPSLLRRARLHSGLGAPLQASGPATACHPENPGETIAASASIRNAAE
jgi:hypothetical protein